MLPILGALLPVIGSVIDRLIPDEAGKAKAKLEMQAALMDAANKGMLAQLDVNMSRRRTGQSLSPGGVPSSDGAADLPWLGFSLSRLS